MISDKLPNAFFGFSQRRLGAELAGGVKHPPPPACGKSSQPAGLSSPHSPGYRNQHTIRTAPVIKMDNRFLERQRKAPKPV